MARAVTVGNGNILVGLDYRGQVRDFYFPHVGHANHVSGASGNYVHRVGVYAEGSMHWLDDAGWDISIGCADDTVVGAMRATHAGLGLVLESTDVVHNEKNIFLRHFTVTSSKKAAREVKLILAQQFRIAESRRGDTGLYDPRVKAIVHYKGTDTFLINAYTGTTQFSEYNIGLFGIEGKEGTWHDATDGVLEKNPVEHGSVDSVIALPATVSGTTSAEFDYWIVCGHSVAEVHDLDAYVRSETPAAIVHTTKEYWRAWLDKESFDISLLSKELQTLYRRSLTTIRVHTDNDGGIIASSDTDMLHHGRDTYSYVWPRDGAIVAHSLDVAGYSDAARRFFTFMTAQLERGGYLMHKYRSDGTLGSSWHPWIIEGQPEFPIQEDETALVLYMLHQHYLIARDLEYLELMYNPFIEPAANFMVEFVSAEYGLPQNSFDLWEENFAVSTYTASATYGALRAAAEIATLLGKDEPARTYTAVADRMQKAILKHLYDEELGMFVKNIRLYDDKDDVINRIVDSSSFHGPVYFGVLEADDPRIIRAATVLEERLRVSGASDGYVRYEQDNYYTLQEAGSPNPWVVTTMWVAQYYIKAATTVAELKRAYELLEWTASHATEAGVLAEQMHPHTREHLSTAPLVWSHAEYVLTCHAYIAAHERLSAPVESKKD